MNSFVRLLMKQVSYTHRLILTNIVLFFGFSLAFFLGMPLGFVELQGRAFFAGQQWWTVITSMFMHQGLIHLFVNMFTLFFIGTFVESLIGRKRFFALYFIAGIVGALFFVFGTYIGQFLPHGEWLFGSMDTYAAGASGALFGLVGLLAVLLPHHRIYLIAGPLVLIIVQVVSDHLLSGVLGTIISVLINVLMIAMLVILVTFNRRLQKYTLPLALPLWLAPVVAIGPLMLMSYFVPLPIGNSAHLGGLIAGMVYGVYLRLRYPLKTSKLSKHFA